MIKNINILFLGGAKRVSLAERFLVSGQEMGLGIKLYTYELDKRVPFSIVGDVIIGKLWNDKNIYIELKKIIDEKNINIVLANVDLATIALAELNNRYPELDLITSDIKTCNIFLDKKIMTDHCIRENIKTIPFSNNEFPMFIKPRRGSASKGTYIVPNKDYKDYVLSQIDKNQFVFQKYIDGIEYTVDAYVSKNGEFIGAVPRIRTSVTAGESTTAMVINDEEILNQTKLILSRFKLMGPICLQFIRKNNELFFMELNPRFGGGVIASIEAGFNTPKIILQEFLGIKIKPQTKYKQLIMTRCQREVFHAIDS